MKMARLGLIFRIFALLVMLLSLAFTALVFMDLPKVLGAPSEVVSPSENIGISNTTDITKEKGENGEITAWKVTLGNITVHNRGDRIEIQDLRLTIIMENKPSDEVYLDIKTKKNVRIKPGEEETLDIPLTFHRAGLLQIADFLSQSFQKALYIAYNDAWTGSKLNETVWNTSVINSTTFNKSLLDKNVLNGSFIDDSVKIEDLFDETALNNSLQQNYNLTLENISTIYQNLNETQIWNNIPGMDKLMARLMDKISFNGRLTVFIGIMGVRLTGVTVKLKEEVLEGMFGG